MPVKGALSKYGGWMLAGAALLGFILLSPLLKRSAYEVGAPTFEDGSKNSETPYGLDQMAAREQEEGLMDPDAEAAERFKKRLEEAKAKRGAPGSKKAEVADSSFDSQASVPAAASVDGYTAPARERATLSGLSQGGGGGGGASSSASGRGIDGMGAAGGAAGGGVGSQFNDHRVKEPTAGADKKGLKALKSANASAQRALSMGNSASAATQAGKSFSGEKPKSGFGATNTGKPQVGGGGPADLKDFNPKDVKQGDMANSNVPTPKKEDFKKDEKASKESNKSAETLGLIQKILDIVKTIFAK